RLDHELAVPKVGERYGPADPSARGTSFALAYALRLHQTRERAVDALKALLDLRLLDLADERIDAGLRADLRDPPSHLSEPDHANARNGHRFVTPWRSLDSI